jgi:hypothetical protein
MRYVGNFKDWIDPKWLEEVLASRGYGRPSEGAKPDTPEMELEYQKAKNAGYRDDAIYFWMFDKKNTTFSVPQPPFVKGNYHWWITKMLPGNFMPMHVDPHTLYQTNSNRYWMPLHDWQPGHIFMYNDQVITNYKAGDVWVYKESNALHGAANIGHFPRVVLQVSTYE